MTRDEFMGKARQEVDQILASQKNRMMKLVEQAWAEGKRNAEKERVQEITHEALETVLKRIEEGPIPSLHEPVPYWLMPGYPGAMPNITCMNSHAMEDDGK